MSTGDSRTAFIEAMSKYRRIIGDKEASRLQRMAFAGEVDEARKSLARLIKDGYSIKENGFF